MSRNDAHRSVGQQIYQKLQKDSMNLYLPGEPINFLRRKPLKQKPKLPQLGATINFISTGNTVRWESSAKSLNYNFSKTGLLPPCLTGFNSRRYYIPSNPDKPEEVSIPTSKPTRSKFRKNFLKPMFVSIPEPTITQTNGISHDFSSCIEELMIPQTAEAESSDYLLRKRVYDPNNVVVDNPKCKLSNVKDTGFIDEELLFFESSFP